MQPRSYRGLALIITMWVLATVIAALASTNLFGLARPIGYAIAMAVGMFANDVVDLDPMFPRMRRRWIATGFTRVITALAGAIAVLFVVVVMSNDWRLSILSAIVIGFVLGGLAGSIVRTIGELRARGRERNPT
jgi:hypothetical protein